MSLGVWVHPNPQHGYVMGVDTAEGLGHGDYSCVHVLDLNTGELVAAWHGTFRLMPWLTRFCLWGFGIGMLFVVLRLITTG